MVWSEKLAEIKTKLVQRKTKIKVISKDAATQNWKAKLAAEDIAGRIKQMMFGCLDVSIWKTLSGGVFMLLYI